MPRRKLTCRVDSAEVQGDGSYVVLRVLPYGAISEAIQRFGQGVAIENNDEWIRKTISTCVIEWNWVDDDGNPLPLPARAEMLYGHEIKFLLQHIAGTDTKN